MPIARRLFLACSIIVLSSFTLLAETPRTSAVSLTVADRQFILTVITVSTKSYILPAPPPSSLYWFIPCFCRTAPILAALVLNHCVV